jgi:hypothetical protein
MINSTPFPDRLAILPSETYLFEQPSSSKKLTNRIVARKTLENGVNVAATNLGLIALDFAGSNLGGFNRLHDSRSGEVPPEVMANNAEAMALQIKRMRIAIFAAACIYGHHAQQTHTTVSSPVYPGLDDFLVWTEMPDDMLGLPVHECERLEAKLGKRIASLQQGLRPLSIGKEHIDGGLALANRLLAASPSYAVADPIAMIAMTYQAMVLHGRQHPSASIALSAIVVEAATEESIYAHGLVNGIEQRISVSKVDRSIKRDPEKSWIRGPRLQTFRGKHFIEICCRQHE